MKALSLHQPWASACAWELKLNETRGWNTHFRGDLIIHAAKTMDMLDVAMPPPETIRESFWQQLLTILGPTNELAVQAMPFGAIVAVVELFATTPTLQLAYAGTLDEIRGLRREPHHIVSPREFAFGNYDPGRYAWHFRSVRRLKTPIPWRGSQGLFDVPDEVVREALAA